MEAMREYKAGKNKEAKVYEKHFKYAYNKMKENIIKMKNNPNKK